MRFVGMDPDTVRGQAERSESASERLTELQQRLAGIVHAVAWSGPDHESFLKQWAVGPDPQLTQLGMRLEDHAYRLRDEADEQDAASSAAHGAPLVPGPAGPADLGDPADLAGPADLDGPFIPALPHIPSETGPVPDVTENVFDTVGERADVRIDEAKQWFWDRYYEDFGDPLHPDRPWAEIHAEDIVEALVEGEKFDHRAEVEVHGVRQITDSEAPEDLADLVLDNNETRRSFSNTKPPKDYDPHQEAQIRIQTVTGADGAERYLVHVPPTQGAPLTTNHEVFGLDTKVPDVDGTLAGWDQQGQPFGWDNNLYAMAGMENAGANAVKAAMASAGIPPGADVAFVGHSQGGLVAAQLAGDPSFNGGTYQVTDVFSVGSPVQTFTPADPGTDMLNVQHVRDEDRRGDIVPELDLEGSSYQHPEGNPAPNVNDVTFGTPEPSNGFPPPDAGHQAHDSVLLSEDGASHDPDSAYYGTVRNNAGDPSLVAKDDRMRGTYYGEGTTMTADVVVDVSRLP